jgi:hypothetical protein
MIEMETKKIIMSTIFVIIILMATIISWHYRELIFTNKVEIKYPNGCEEVYVNTELVSEKCNYEEQQLLNTPQFTFNYTT